MSSCTVQITCDNQFAHVPQHFFVILYVNEFIHILSAFEMLVFNFPCHNLCAENMPSFVLCSLGVSEYKYSHVLYAAHIHEPLGG